MGPRLSAAARSTWHGRSTRPLAPASETVARLHRFAAGPGWRAAAALVDAAARGSDTIGVVPRLSLWLITAIACLILVQEPGWRGYAGVSEPTWRTLGWAALAVVLSLVGATVISRAQGSAPEAALQASDQFGKVAALSQPRRMLLVVTAGGTEVVLYRAYAIGLGSYLLGSTWLAAGLSLVAFTLGHFRWGLAHLWPVFWAGAVMSGVFVAVAGHFGLCLGSRARRCGRCLRRACNARETETPCCYPTRRLTPPSSGRSKGRFAPFGPPLMSNVSQR